MKTALYNYLVKRQSIATARSMSPGAPVVRVRIISAAFSSCTEYLVTPRQVSVLIRAYGVKRGNSAPVLGTSEKSYAILGQYLGDFCEFLASFPAGFYSECSMKTVQEVLQHSCYNPKRVISSDEYSGRLAEARALVSNGFKPFSEVMA